MGNYSQKTVLVVDDNPLNLYVLKKILKQDRYQPILANNGKQALQIVHQETPDLILLDINMPEMDGYEVCRRLKSNPATENIPVIFLSARTESDDIVQGFDAGAVDYVTKPFNGAELLARIKTHIEIRVLRGLLPICVQCKKIRDTQDYWNQIEYYIENHSNAQFTHGICPECSDKLYGDEEWYQNAKQCGKL